MNGELPLTVILADGEIPSHRVALAFLRAASRVIACDGAWKNSTALGRVPDAVVGDCDSIGEDDICGLKLAQIPVVRDGRQDDNDLCKAFRYALASGAVRIVILGADGKRDDHMIGNVFHLLDFAGRCAEVTMVTNAGVFSPVLPPSAEFDCRRGDPVSIFAPSPDTVMESEGLEWPLDGVKFDTLWRGTLNRAASNRVTLRTNRPILLYRPHHAVSAEKK